MNKYIRYTLLFLVVASVAGVAYFYLLQKSTPETITPLPTIDAPQQEPSQTEEKAIPPIPLPDAKERITKKPFGIYITSQNSPVQPEKFQGYHTGTDFETFSEEQDKEIAISAICEGKAISSGHVSGYGGLLIQNCSIDGQKVTVLYGHLALASLPKTNTDIKKGQRIGILAPADSSESSFERKHLHLGIHKGETIDYSGYVNAKNQLDSWLDAELYYSK
ncbi:hypothetical protein COY62_04405 [bacterium (Candidatus Howlettbacteria) CG_4_10_14_0_8_um_filter_40_9]|nr:MAG: hypothetical protein COY62_04405 [bacterium (Candidatus Howlettbacteria) CG_4_10_14_0_8_um_filter_40_9]